MYIQNSFGLSSLMFIWKVWSFFNSTEMSILIHLEPSAVNLMYSITEYRA